MKMAHLGALGRAVAKISLVQAALWTASAHAAPSTVERLSDLAWLARDDAGIWSNGSMGNTHQLAPDYCAKKILDLSMVPEDVWSSTKAARLSVFF